MSSISVPHTTPFVHDNMRLLNITRDLPAVADLIEICFDTNLDSDGRRYIQQMRRAGQDNAYLRWASRAVENVSMPLSGYVWEQDDRIVGNASLVPFRKRGQFIFLIANIAVHPDYRRRGIARSLTQQAMRHARERKANQLWLNVRENNPGAVELYQKLGFHAHSCRVIWKAQPDSLAAPVPGNISIRPRQNAHWSQQRGWLAQAYPKEIDWYYTVDWNNFAPGLRRWLYLLFFDMEIRQWSGLKNHELQATLTWSPGRGSNEGLWLAASTQSDPRTVTALLQHARHEIVFRRGMRLDYPNSELDDAILAAGFVPVRKLIWMQADGATS